MYSASAQPGRVKLSAAAAVIFAFAYAFTPGSMDLTMDNFTLETRRLSPGALVPGRDVGKSQLPESIRDFRIDIRPSSR